MSEQHLPATVARRPDAITWMFGLDKPTLTDRPQRWGVIPTFRFWNRLDTAKYQVVPLTAGLAAAALFSKLASPLLAGLLGVFSLVIVLPMIFVLTLLPLGLFERWLRREIESRRALPAASQPDE